MSKKPKATHANLDADGSVSLVFEIMCDGPAIGVDGKPIMIDGLPAMFTRRALKAAVEAGVFDGLDIETVEGKEPEPTP